MDSRSKSGRLSYLVSSTIPQVDRSELTPSQCIAEIWSKLGLPQDALASLHIEDHGLTLPSSFKIGHLAATSVGLTGLLAGLIYATKHGSEIPKVRLSSQHATLEFMSERLYTLNDEKPVSAWGPIGGLHKTADGFVRVHDNFPHHKDGTLALLGCPKDATKNDVAKAISTWKSIDLETEAAANGLVIAALRNYDEWACTSQAEAVRNFPILIRNVASSPPVQHGVDRAGSKCLSGLKVLDLSRVIAAPVAGRTLAVHGADVLWVTSPSLPDLPSLDRDMARGKRTIQLDLRKDSDMAKLQELLLDADVFLQSYRPGSLAARGLSVSQINDLRGDKPMVYANLSAYGPYGPWRERRGFDSLVQTCTGMNVSEAEHFGADESARPMPCQALDHAAGYFLAAGIMAALYKQTNEGGSFLVNVSLAGVMKYLRSLGQHEGKTGFDSSNYQTLEDVPPEFIAAGHSELGEFRYIKHSVSIDGVDVGWSIMPKPLGSDAAVWAE